MLQSAWNVWYVLGDPLKHLQTNWTWKPPELKGPVQFLYVANLNGLAQSQYVANIPP